MNDPRLARNTNAALGGGGFHHVAINARDFDASVAFYRDALGFVPKILWGVAPARGAMLDVGDGNYLEIFEKPHLPAGPSAGAILHFAIRCSSVNVAIEKARVAGVEVTIEPTDVNIPMTHPKIGTMPLRMAFFRGPDNEIVEFFENEMT